MSQAERRSEQMLKYVKEGTFALAKANEGDAISARGFPGSRHGNGPLNFGRGDWGGGNRLNPQEERLDIGLNAAVKCAHRSARRGEETIGQDGGLIDLTVMSRVPLNKGLNCAGVR